VSTIGLFICLLRPFRPENTPLLGKILSWVVLPLAGVKPVIHNRDKFNNVKGPCVFISNHQNNLDAFIIGSFVPDKTVSIGKKIIRWFPFFGQIYWLGGNILIDRKRTKKAMGAMSQAAKKMDKIGMRVWVMPEGTRNHGEGLLRFKKGAFYLALQTGYPIVPVSIGNYVHRLQMGKFESIHLHINVHDPISYEDIAGSDREKVEAMSEKCRQILDQGIKEMDDLAK